MSSEPNPPAIDEQGRSRIETDNKAVQATLERPAAVSNVPMMVAPEDEEATPSLRQDETLPARSAAEESNVKPTSAGSQAVESNPSTNEDSSGSGSTSHFYDSDDRESER